MDLFRSVVDEDVWEESKLGPSARDVQERLGRATKLTEGTESVHVVLDETLALGLGAKISRNEVRFLSGFFDEAFRNLSTDSQRTRGKISLRREHQTRPTSFTVLNLFTKIRDRVQGKAEEAAVKGPTRINNSLFFFFRNVGDRDVGAFTGEEYRDRSPDTRIPSRDETGFSLEFARSDVFDEARLSAVPPLDFRVLGRGRHAVGSIVFTDSTLSRERA